MVEGTQTITMTKATGLIALGGAGGGGEGGSGAIERVTLKNVKRQ